MGHGNERHTTVAVGMLLAAAVVIAYRAAFGLPFLNDDYLFLEKVRDASFADLWKPERLYFHWYRPWSRELHYWLLWRLFGAHELPYHVVSFGLWLVAALLYFRLSARLTGDRFAAAVALGGVAALALWAGPLCWIAGVQDLWMLVFALLFLHAVVAERYRLACLPLALALLSKETAAVLPAFGTAYVWLLARRPVTSALGRTAWHWGLLAGWAVLHPTLGARVFKPGREFIEVAHRLPWPAAVARTALSQVNLDQWPAPEAGWPRALAAGVATAALLTALLMIASRGRPGVAPAVDRARVVRFGIVWAALGWAVLLLPSIGWHPYYGVLGTLGCWLVIGLLTSRHLGMACVLVASLAIIGAARADTPSWDWGTAWYQNRAGAILGSIREWLRREHPALPSGSRLFFARLPNSIGFVAGDGPAIRVWYGDPSLRAMYYSEYRPRSSRDSAGVDYFFRFDTVRVLVEVRTGAESVDVGRRSHDWQRDHDVLAALFIRTGNMRGAANEYAKLALAFPDQPEYALYAGAAHEAVGAMDEANALYRTAASAYGAAVVRERADDLLRSLPSPSRR